MPKSVSDIFTKREAKQPRLPPRAGWCSLMLWPSFAFQAMPFWPGCLCCYPCLPVVSFICQCHFVPFSGCQWGRFIPEQMRNCSHPSAPRAPPAAPCPVCAQCPGAGSGQLLRREAAFPLLTVPACSSGRKLSAAYWVSSQSRESALLGSVWMSSSGLTFKDGSDFWPCCRWRNCCLGRLPLTSGFQSHVPFPLQRG